MAALAEFVHQDQVVEAEDREPSLSMRGLPMPFTLRSAAPVTDEALMQFARQNRLYGIERNSAGELEVMSPTGGEGSVWENIVSGELLFWAKVNGGRAFNSNAGFNLPDGSMRMPDAAWVSEVRWSALTKQQRQGLPPICPEFVVEVLSLHDSRPTLEAKMLMWIANGAQLAWLIDPYKATVSIYKPGVAPQVLERPDSIEAADPVPGFRLSTLLLWDE